MLHIEKALDKYLKINIEDKSDKELLEKQYEKLLDFITKANESRASLNNFHQTVAAAVVGIISGIYNFKLPDKNKYAVIALIASVGLALCYTWSGELKRFYRSAQILDAIAARIEGFLPVNPLDTRLKLLATLNAPARTEKQEQMIPMTFSFVYLTVIFIMGYLIFT
ncbi:MAG: hypothetical protein K0Q51_660 [Rickettsiaceae bacterium]|jgi:hypothetical protein|nr:hypothetical protein [Rickettsiaceae bacterium]